MEYSNKFWKDKRVVVTGGAGFLGGHLVALLKQKKPKQIIVPRSSTLDLRKWENCKSVVKNADIVIHLAGVVGGIGFNRLNPGKIYYDNILMGTYLIDESFKAGVKKFVAIGTICAYPKFTKVPFKEEDLWNGYPEETNAPYGLAKKMLLVQSQAYRQQYGFNSIYLLPVNLYGPNDNFNPTVSHVIPALIKKVVEAKIAHSERIVVWGTGTATREFLYVGDAAIGILQATEKYNNSDPVNIGSGMEISIKELIHLICKILKYEGKIEFDATKPDGQPRRRLDVRKATKLFGFKAKVKFEEGMIRTIKWYEKNYT